MRFTLGPALSLASRATRLYQRKRNPMANPTDEIRRLAAKVTDAADRGEWSAMTIAIFQMADLVWEGRAEQLRTAGALRCPECHGLNLNEVGVAPFDIPVCVFPGGACAFGPVEIVEFPEEATYRCQDCDSGELTADTLVTAQTI